MQSYDDTARKLREFIQKQILADGIPLTNETSLEAIGVDSFALMEVILFIERQFGIVLPMEELTPETIESVGSLSRCVCQQPGR